MNYIGKEVVHKNILGKGSGHGVIIDQNLSYVFVRFDSGEEKQFKYPDCFGGFLHLLDSEAEQKAQIALQTKTIEDKLQKAKKRAEINASISDYAVKTYKTQKPRRIEKQIKTPSYSSVKEFCEEQEKLLVREIVYLKENGGKRIRITDGKLVERQGNSYIYSFESDVEVNVPDNTPISVWTRQQEEAISGTIVNSEEFTIIIAVEQYLDESVPAIQFTADASYLLQMLIERLRDIKETASSLVQDLICNGKESISPGDMLQVGQETACDMSSSQPITFIWGPPGTGKTKTLAEIALSHIEMGYKVLMVSYSNVSVDGAVLRVFHQSEDQEPGKILRYGYPKDKEVADHEYLSSYNFTLKNHPELIEERKTLKNERRALSRESARYVEIGKRLTEIRKLLREEEKESVHNAVFVATTISKAIADSAIYKSSFDTVIVDEASMSYIPQIVFAAGLAVNHFICMGDFAQLPPIVQSDNSNSLNADIFHYCGIAEAVEKGVGHDWLCMLDTQYRMHPDIAGFSSRFMYHGLLRSSDDMEQNRKDIVKSRPLEGKALALVDLSGMMSECRKTADQSRINVLSGFVTMALAASAAEAHEVGVITPYRAQSSLLHAMARDLMDKNEDEETHKITCATVHQFQGSEKDVIIYDAVDCYRMPYPGALISSTNNNNANRLYNVAMTRAKGKFISVVNVDYMKNKKLSKKLVFRRMIDQFKNNNQQTSFSKTNLKLKNNALSLWNTKEAKQEYLQDLKNAKKEVCIDVPQGIPAGDLSFMDAVVDVFEYLKKRGIKICVRTDEKDSIPERIKRFVIEQPYITDPVTVIDNAITWYGMLPSTAQFVSEGTKIKINHRPIFRFEGKRFARSVYGLLNMNRQIDSPKKLPANRTQDRYDTFSAYVYGEVKCSACGRPMRLRRGKSFFLGCSGYPNCDHTESITADLVNKYLTLFDKRCYQDGASLEAREGKYGTYIQCKDQLDQHRYKLNEI